MPTQHCSSVLTKKSTQTGAALITALLIMTLVAIAATAMSLRFQIDVARTRLTINADRMLLAAQVVPIWAIGQLKQAITNMDPKNPNNKIDHLPLTFPQAKFAYPGVTISGQLDDLQAKFNLNSLAQPTNIPRFVQLIIAVDPKIQGPQAAAIAQAIADWIKPLQMDTVTPDNYYSQQHPGYLPAHAAMASVSELKLVKGMTEELYEALEPYVSTLSQTSTININTAPIPVLQTLGVGLNQSQAKLIVNSRGKDGFATTADLQNNPKLKELAIPDEQITVVSDYFIATALAKTAEQQLLLYTLLQRSKPPGGNTPNNDTSAGAAPAGNATASNEVKVNIIGQYLNTL